MEDNVFDVPEHKRLTPNQAQELLKHLHLWGIKMMGDEQFLSGMRHFALPLITTLKRLTGDLGSPLDLGNKVPETDEEVLTILAQNTTIAYDNTTRGAIAQGLYTAKRKCGVAVEQAYEETLKALLGMSDSTVDRNAQFWRGPNDV
jgi:hypothetical protein